MTWIQKQTSFRCSLARSFPHKLELLSILISEISDERIGKQENVFGPLFGAPKAEQEKSIGAFLRQRLFTAARSASCRKGLRVLEIDAFFEVPRTV